MKSPGLGRGFSFWAVLARPDPGEASDGTAGMYLPVGVITIAEVGCLRRWTGQVSFNQQGMS